MSRDVLLNILISVEHICTISALTKGDLYALYLHMQKKNLYSETATLFLHKVNRKLLPLV